MKTLVALFDKLLFQFHLVRRSNIATMYGSMAKVVGQLDQEKILQREDRLKRVRAFERFITDATNRRLRRRWKRIMTKRTSSFYVGNMPDHIFNFLPHVPS